MMALADVLGRFSINTPPSVFEPVVRSILERCWNPNGAEIFEIYSASSKDQ